MAWSFNRFLHSTAQSVGSFRFLDLEADGEIPEASSANAALVMSLKLRGDEEK